MLRIPRASTILIVAILMTATAATRSQSALAKASPEDLAACQSEEAAPQERIEKCTLVIDDAEQIAAIRAEAFLNRGISREATDDLKGAIADFSESIRLNPEYASPYVYRGMALELDGQPEQALADLSQALKLEPDNVEALAARASINLAMGNTDEAIKDFSEAIVQAPDDSDNWAGRGEAHEKKGDRERAAADYRKALELEPDNQTAKAGVERMGSKI